MRLLEQVSAKTSSDQNTHTEGAATSTSDSEVCRLLSVSLPQDAIHHETATAARTNPTALSKGWVTMVCAAVTMAVAQLSKLSDQKTAR